MKRQNKKNNQSQNQQNSDESVGDICPECGSIIESDTCRVCGLVFNSYPISYELTSTDLDSRNTASLEAIGLDIFTTHGREGVKTEELASAFRNEKIYKTPSSAYWKGVMEIKRVVSALDLTKNIYNDAIFLWQRLYKKNFHNKFHKRILSADCCIKLAAIANHYPLSYESLMEITDNNSKNLRKYTRIIINFLNLKIVQDSFDNYILGILPKFDLSDETRVKIILISKKLKLNGNYKGWAGALIYMTGEVLQREIIEKLKVSQTTINRRTIELKRMMSVIK